MAGKRNSANLSVRAGSHQLCTISEMGSVLRISRSACYKLLDSGEIPKIRVGHGSVRVRQSDLFDYIDRAADRRLDEVEESDQESTLTAGAETT